MKILFSSYAFYPSVGGIESVSALLAAEFVGAGHEVELITETAGDRSSGENYPVTRRPSCRTLMRLLRWSDIVFQNNISLRHLIPAMLFRKRVIVVHQTWIQNPRGQIGWTDRIKLALLPYVTNVAISEAVAKRLKVPAVVIGNPYRDDVFRELPSIARNKALVFVGRLVSDKGLDLLLRALKLLQQKGLNPGLTIIGSGPEESNLRRLASELRLDSQVTFVGHKSGTALAEILNQHRILVVPSRWAEPFGVVALEGIACGCIVVGSENGGLKDAIGPCGRTFPNGNEQALAAALQNCLSESVDSLRAAAPAHLARFKAQTVAQAYRDLMQRLIA
jgi:glycosyltransferase involved in cell wall biosynthesis